MIHQKCYTILYYTILYYTILYYTILYYTILYYTILYYTILYYTILYYTILYYTILYYTILYYTILYYTILYYTILYYTILYYTIKATDSSKEFAELLQKRISPSPGWQRPLFEDTKGIVSLALRTSASFSVDKVYLLNVVDAYGCYTL